MSFPGLTGESKDIPLKAGYDTIKINIMNNKKKIVKKKKVIVAVSGGFDPLHVGHARMFQKAKSLGDYLVVILNNDNWLKLKKGFSFMPDKERKELLEHIRWVDEVVLSFHKKGTSDMSICNELKKIKPHIFANGGDRTHDNIPEVPVCEQLGTKMIFNIGRGGKIQSSSWLLEAHKKRKLSKKK